MVTIYEIVCLENGYRYVGCTEGKPSKRLREHRCLLNKGRHYSERMMSDWRKYGERCFSLRTLERFDGGLEQRREAELKWLRHFKAKGLLYNKAVQAFAPQEWARKLGHEAARNPEVRRRAGAVRKQRQTHCKNGHEYTEENTIINSKGRRECHICKLAASRRYERKKKAMR